MPTRKKGRERPRRKWDRDVRTPEALAAIRKLKGEFPEAKGNRIWVEMREREVYPRRRCGGTRQTTGGWRREYPGCCASCLRPKAPRKKCTELVENRKATPKLRAHYSIVRADGSISFGGFGRCPVQTELGGGWTIEAALKKARADLKKEREERD